MTFLKPCVECGAPSRDGRCAQHRLAQTRYRQWERWQDSRRVVKLRPRILRRDNWTCQNCGHMDRKATSLEIDHIVAWADGGRAEMSNLWTLCHPCHARKTASEGRRRASKGRNPLQ